MRRRYLNIFRSIGALGMLLLANMGTATAEERWTLNASVTRVLEVAPELRAAQADINVRRGELVQAGAFPNPSVELRADEKLGIDDGQGGIDLTQAAISQALPLRRLARQEKMAAAHLNAAEETLRQQRLQLEYRTAQAYHTLQLAQARLALAEQRLAVAETYSHRGARAGDPVVRYLSRGERLRIDILRESARQALASAEGEQSEALATFRTLLALPANGTPMVSPLGPVLAPPAQATLEARLAAHPALAAGQQQFEAAQAGIDVAYSQRFADPVVSIFRERDYLNGGRRDYSGVMLSVQVPLWNFNNGNVGRARAEADKVDAQNLALARDLGSRLRLSSMHLNHLIAQARDYLTGLVGPTEQSLDLARKGFAAGQTDLLTLIDANNTHFDAHFRYLELLQLGWMEAAELRLATGLSVREYAQGGLPTFLPE